MFLFTTVPAPTIEFFFTSIGAINEVFEPIKQLSPIIVLCFFNPSKLHVIEPAPILVFLPIVASPMYDK